MTKTEAKILARIAQLQQNFPGYAYVQIEGKREDAAAQKLAAERGWRYVGGAEMTGGEYYVHPFTRRPALTRPVVVYGGLLYFRD